MIHRTAIGLVGLLVCASAVAQVTPHERCLIKGVTGAWASGSITYNVARDGVRTQQNWVRGDNLPNPFVFLEFGERVEQGASPALTYRIQAIFDNVSFGWAQLNVDPKKNLTANAVTVFDSVLSFPAITGTSPNQVHMWIKLTRPFVFTGPHFLIEKTWDPGTVATGTRLIDSYSMINVSNQHLSAGKSCGGSLTAAYSGTGNYSATITAAPPNVVAMFLIAIENVMFAGTIPLPIDMAIFGMPGCELGVEPLVLVPLLTDAAGRAQMTAPFALPAETVTWSVQGFHQTASAWATTNVINTFIGDKGLAGNLRIDKRGVKGPDPFNNNGPVVLVRGR